MKRITQDKALFHTGFPIIMGRYSGFKSQKAYVCLFVCVATKALYLELVSSLFTEALIVSHKRFILRRGN